MGNQAPQVDAATVEAAWRNASADSDFAGLARQSKVMRFGDELFKAIQAQVITAKLITLALDIATLLSPNADISPYTAAILSTYFSSCGDLAIHSSAPDLDPLFEKEVGPLLQLDVLWRASIGGEAEAYVTEALRERREDSYLSRLPAELLRALKVYCTPPPLVCAMPPAKLEVEWRVASGPRTNQNAPTPDVVLRHLLTGRALWRSALGSHKIEDLVTTDDGYVLGSSSTHSDIVILKPPRRHPVQIVRASWAVCATLGTRIFCLERDSEPCRWVRLSEVVRNPATGAWTLRLLKEVTLPRPGGDLMSRALHVVATADGPLAVVLVMRPEVALLHFVDGDKRSGFEATLTLESTFLLGIQPSSMPPPVVVGSLIYFMDVTPYLRVLAFDLRGQSKKHVRSHALSLGIPGPIGSAYLTLRPRGNILACVLHRYRIAWIDIDPHSAEAAQCRVVRMGVGVTHGTPVMEGDVLLLPRDSVNHRELLWISIPLATVVATQLRFPGLHSQELLVAKDKLLVSEAEAFYCMRRAKEYLQIAPNSGRTDES